MKENWNDLDEMLEKMTLADLVKALIVVVGHIDRKAGK